MTTTHNNTETVSDIHGNKVGVVECDGGEWVAYNLSDIEVYRGPSFTAACDAARGES